MSLASDMERLGRLSYICVRRRGTVEDEGTDCTMRLGATAASAAPCTPSNGRSTNGVDSAPAIAPTVLAEYSRPPAAPMDPGAGEETA